MNETTNLTTSFQIYEREREREAEKENQTKTSSRKKYPMIFIWIYNVFFSIILAVHDDDFHSIISFSAMMCVCACMREHLNVVDPMESKIIQMRQA